jgi:hypothetical protein
LLGPGEEDSSIYEIVWDESVQSDIAIREACVPELTPHHRWPVVIGNEGSMFHCERLQA